MLHTPQRKPATRRQDPGCALLGDEDDAATTPCSRKSCKRTLSPDPSRPESRGRYADEVLIRTPRARAQVDKSTKRKTASERRRFSTGADLASESKMADFLGSSSSTKETCVSAEVAVSSPSSTFLAKTPLGEGTAEVAAVLITRNDLLGDELEFLMDNSIFRVKDPAAFAAVAEKASVATPSAGPPAKRRRLSDLRKEQAARRVQKAGAPAPGPAAVDVSNEMTIEYQGTSVLEEVLCSPIMEEELRERTSCEPS